MSVNHNPKFEALLEYLRQTRGFDFAAYKRSSLVRRMEKRMQAVQILVTSLLVQAGRAMTAEGRGSGGGGHARSRSFRQSFLVAYADRIGERLQETAEGGTAEASDDRLLPVLAARASAVDDTVAGSFGELSSKAVSGHDPAGRNAGRAAADAATLTLDRDRLDG